VENVRQDLANFKLTGDRSKCITISALLASSNHLALHATFEAVDIYRLKKSAGKMTAPADMGRFSSQWQQWRKELKATLKTRGGPEVQTEGRELGRRMQSIRLDSFGSSSGVIRPLPAPSSPSSEQAAVTTAKDEVTVDNPVVTPIVAA
jgi:hypothetical protein